MCGFAGCFAADGSPNRQWVQAMTACLKHRGPDAEGFYHNEHVAMGHRRLSIIDLSPAANQPMTSSDGRWVMMFNGEVFNFRDLSKEIRTPLKTHSDTEVLMELFALEGPQAVQKFNGMFAIALFDKREKELHLFRDRAGVKPLFWMMHLNQLFFASEIKALLSVPGIRNVLSVNYPAVNLFLQLGYIPEPHTIYREIQKFPSGNRMVAGKQGTAFHLYWSPVHKPGRKSGSGGPEQVNTLRTLLESSVEYRMISDVPFGTFLSGGVDSSLVTAIAAKKSNALNTYTIGFEEAAHNEAPHAEKIASYLKTNHHTFIITQEEARSVCETSLDIFDEPFADSSAIPSLLISKRARKEVKMVLTGDGGDELFMGYGMHRWARRLQHPAVRAFRRPLVAALAATEKFAKAAEMLQYEPPETGDREQHIFTTEQGFFPKREIQKLLDGYYVNSRLPLPGSQVHSLSAAEKQSLFDLVYYLKDDLLVKVDRASMYYGLECRTPFLDFRIIEFALRLPETAKMNRRELKILPKLLLKEYLPASLFDRPKRGFSIPLARWLRYELKGFMQTYLSDEALQSVNLLHPAVVSKTVSEFESGKDHLANRIWSLVALQRWWMKENPVNH